MKSLRILFPLLVLAGCSNATGPGFGIDGTWVAYGPEWSTVITLNQRGSMVTGTGSYSRNINPPTGTIEISGTAFHNSLDLTFRYDTGVTTQYSAHLESSGQISGTETLPGGGMGSLTFVRQVD